jgi:hypothetical protein
MALRPEPTDTLEPDWFAVTQAAQALGSGTRRLVASHDTDGAIAWCLQMSREHSGVTSLSYYELAVMLGHRDKKTRERAALEWNSLLREVEALAGAVKAKAAEEKAAEEKRIAEEKRAAEEAAAKAAAEKEAAEEATEDTFEDVADMVVYVEPPTEDEPAA